ncbi:MAG: DUF370 domain-containing protein [Lachnospiraceae bacterium]|nr:DUF370 domain-containing protein [Lachnospiraceae bacterium]
MFLHLGGDFSVRAGDVISVHEYEFLMGSQVGQEFLKGAKNRMEDVSDGKPKSVVVTDHKIYFSKLSPGTLKKRVEDFWYDIAL